MVTMKKIFRKLICANPKGSDYRKTTNKYEVLYSTLIYSNSIEGDTEDWIVEILYQFNKEICGDKEESYCGEFVKYPLTDFKYVKSIKIIRRDGEYMPINSKKGEKNNDNNGKNI